MFYGILFIERDGVFDSWIDVQFNGLMRTFHESLPRLLSRYGATLVSHESPVVAYNEYCFPVEMRETPPFSFICDHDKQSLPGIWKGKSERRTQKRKCHGVRLIDNESIRMENKKSIK